MKYWLMIALFVIFSASAMASQWVSGYTRSNGTYVESYQRSTPSESYTIKGEWKY